MKKRILVMLMGVVTFLVLLTGCVGETVFKVEGGSIDDDYLTEEYKENPYDIIPTHEDEEYEFVGWFSESTFDNRITEENYSKYKHRELYAKWIKRESSYSFVVREETVTITDSGRINQQVDRVYLPTELGCNLDDLQYLGYEYFDVKITLSAYEINDGYRYVFVCKSLNEYEDEELLHYLKFEHGAGFKAEYWGDFTFNVRININDISEDLYIRYGASGNGDDDWKNCNVKMEIVPSKI